jgi:hypothetical protein
MKRGAFNHSKMRLLMSRLKIPRYAAVGILESLWDLTANEAPRGDIGRLSDERIAMFLDWEGQPEALISGLHYAGWLDSHPEYRYLVHDWPEHCEDSVDARLFRMGQKFADGSEPRGKKVGNKEKVSIAKRKSAPKGEIQRPSSATPEFQPPKLAEDFTPAEIAMSIIQETNSGGQRVMLALTDVAKSLMQHMSAEQARDAMLSHWKKYTEAASRLNWTYSGIDKFFSGGMWNKPDMWPWKDGQKPQPTPTGRRIG